MAHTEDPGALESQCHKIPSEDAIFDDGQCSGKSSLPTLAVDESPSFAARLWHIVDEKLIGGFSPAFYASVMGTGISGNILYGFPFPAHWLKVCGVIMATVALVLFILLTVVFGLALRKDSQLWSKIHRDPAQAPGMGCLVMGYLTLIFMLNSLAGKSWSYAVWVLWWIATFMSVYTSFLTFFFSVMGKHRKRANVLDTANISLTFLLPVVTLTVAASAGGVITPNMPHVNMKIITMVVSFIMWAIAVTLAFIVVAVNFWRLFVHKIPATGQVFSMFLPIGFLGQGAFAILLFGRNCVELILDHSGDVAESAYTSFLHGAAKHHDLSQLPVILATALLTVSTLLAMMLMSFGFFFTYLAFASLLLKMQPFARKPNPQHIYARVDGNFIQRSLSGLLRFNRGFWSMTFPLGTMALCNGEMYKLWNGMEAFRYISAIYAVVVFIVTLGCLSGVVYNVIKLVKSAMRAPTEHKDMV